MSITITTVNVFHTHTKKNSVNPQKKGLTGPSYTTVTAWQGLGYVMSEWMDEWVSEWVRDVLISHQSDWIYYIQPIKFLVVKVNGMWEDLIPIEFRMAIFILL